MYGIHLTILFNSNLIAFNSYLINSIHTLTSFPVWFSALQYDISPLNNLCMLNTYRS